MMSHLSSDVRQYMVVTGNYWAFTLSDGALRMLVVLHFHGLGYAPLEIALLFLFYEVFGVLTNLFGGWLGARWGLNRTMHIGLVLQVLALAMLLVPTSWLSVAWVMAAQALSGIAKDLNKMSAKSAIKLLLPEDAEGRLFKWVAVLTGSKNALKGAGFFLGGLLLMTLGFTGAIASMAGVLALVWLASLFLLRNDLGKTRYKPKFRDLFSKSRAVNVLSAARLFLFGARDVWFVVALPVFLVQTLGWAHGQTGAFLAVWVIGYGVVQAAVPSFTNSARAVPGAILAALVLMLIPAGIAVGMQVGWSVQTVVVTGLLVFGVVFAVNSSLHSFLIVHFADRQGVALDVGFYYMSNALGRLLGTVLSGALFQWGGQGIEGLQLCLWVASLLLLLTLLISIALPTTQSQIAQ